MNLAVIPARGGSKRIPRKNIRHFHGKPIIAYAIAAALESRLFDKVLVSTEDQEIADIAMRFGAEVPFLRPMSLADDHVGIMPVLQHALSWMQTRSESVSMLACIFPAAPTIHAGLLAQAEAFRIKMDADYCFSVTRFPSPIERALRMDENKKLEPIYPEHRLTRTQDLPLSYFDAGMFYLGKAHAFVKNLPIHSSHSVGFELPRLLTQDIDSEEDWAFAEAIYEIALRQRTSFSTP